ncbi:hypothetical protein MKW98_023885 [Papaver atlanticum]|uniref:Uncharacterized protein n=1 Tax=Papaver atlanticum TaxID=357466 RepID=A0AAD4SZM9_9MAGN|nr:hypothetical protein MKW98_023885 [Papaver atlanticum]
MGGEKSQIAKIQDSSPNHGIFVYHAVIFSLFSSSSYTVKCGVIIIGCFIRSELPPRVKSNNNMKKKRDTDIVCNESSIEDDFEIVQPKKRKTINPVISYKCHTKDSTRLFRANFGSLNDLFRDLENKRICLTERQLEAIRSCPFSNLLQVFMDNQISKEQLTNINKGIEMLIHSFISMKDGKSGFKLHEGDGLYFPTPEDLAVILGLQLITNGIEDKLTKERKITPCKNDLCMRYKFGDTKLPVIKSTEVQVAIQEAITKGEVDDVVRLIVFFICQTNFFHKNRKFQSSQQLHTLFFKVSTVLFFVTWQDKESPSKRIMASTLAYIAWFGGGGIEDDDEREMLVEVVVVLLHGSSLI